MSVLLLGNRSPCDAILETKFQSHPVLSEAEMNCLVDRVSWQEGRMIRTIRRSEPNLSIVNNILGPEKSIQYQEKALAAFRLLGTNAVPALPKLSKRLRNRDCPNSVCEAIFLIGSSGIPVFVEALQAPHERVRQSAASYLGRYAAHVPLSKGVVNSLVLASKDKIPEVRRSAAIAIGMAHEHPDVSIPALVLCGKDPSPEVRAASALALAAFGAEARSARPLLLELAKDSNGMVRVEALNALSSVGRE